MKEQTLPVVIREESEIYRHKLPINHKRTCSCEPTHINCMTAKEWLKCQLGVWQFFYEARDVRDKDVHPAVVKMKKHVEICNHCGRDVSFGSGLFVNRAPDLNSVTTRIANNLKYPEGDFVCIECDSKTSDDWEAKRK